MVFHGVATRPWRTTNGQTKRYSGRGPLGTADRTRAERHCHGLRPSVRAGDARRERERFFGAGLYERTTERRGYANGYKPKRIDTPAGTVAVDVPKTAGHDGTPFYPQSLERGRRSVRAVMLAMAEMYVKGVSTREAESVMREFGIESLSSSQVSRAARLLDDELEAWRTRELGEIKYLILDAPYEKMRHGGIVRDAAVLSALGIGPDERRRVLGVSVALSEAEVHWRAFLESLQARGMRGVEYVVSDDHAGLRAARRAVLGGATWQRCHFHLARNGIHHSPNLAIRKRIGAELRAVWNAGTLAKAETALAELVTAYRDTAPKLAAWLEENVPVQMQALLRVRAGLRAELAGLERRLRDLAKEDAACRLMMTMPGVGPVVALTVKSAIDDPGRFQSSKDVGPWAGLTPGRYQSGEVDVVGAITRAGDVGLRTALYQAATVMMHRGKLSWLKAWGLQVARRRGTKRAVVAMARRIGVVLHRMWVDGTEFRLTRPDAPTCAAA
nr:IS256 family transposase [uncultured Jannaschia sp.]